MKDYTLIYFKIGSKVKMKTASGNIEGIIAVNYKNTNKNQFAVKFYFEGHENTQVFSKKTGLPYNNKALKNKGVKII